MRYTRAHERRSLFVGYELPDDRPHDYFFQPDIVRRDCNQSGWARLDEVRRKPPVSSGPILHLTGSEKTNPSGCCVAHRPSMSFEASRVEAVLFDVDGTLADTDDDYIQRVARLIRPVHFLFPRRDPTPFLRWGLMTAESPLNTLMGIPDWMGIDDEWVAFNNWLSDLRGHKLAGRFVLMPGVEPMLAGLSQRYPLAVVTARSQRVTDSFLEQFGVEKFFRAVVCAQTVPHTKPYPDPVRWAAKALGVPAENCLMVGDTTVDILAGKRAGAQATGVLCGFGERRELERAGADLILDRTADLAEVLLK